MATVRELCYVAESRMVDGADAARFLATLSEHLAEAEGYVEKGSHVDSLVVAVGAAFDVMASYPSIVR